MQLGRASVGPVFPASRSRRAGKGSHKRRGVSYSKPLRHWLLACGVTRHEVHHDTVVSRAADFHSFRRAFASALGRAGTYAQQSMRLAGHGDMKTHMRYVHNSEPAECPEEALPRMPVMPGPEGESGTG